MSTSAKKTPSSKKPVSSPPKKKKTSTKSASPKSSSGEKSIITKMLTDLLKFLKLDKKNRAKTIKLNLPFLIFAWAGNKFAQAWSMSGGDIEVFMSKINTCLSNPMPSLKGFDLMVGIGVALAVKLILYMKKKNAKKFRHNEEYGSARWGTEKDIEPYMSEVPTENVILTQTEGLTMESRPKSGVKYARNKNIMVVGGSGSGKTRFFVKPNIMQMHSAYVVTDPKGTVMNEVGTMLVKNGYKIKVLNTINFSKSMHYNPFAYLHNEEDILKLVNTIISNTKGDGDKGGEDFWVKAERLLYTAYIGFIFYEMKPEERTFETLIRMINASETREDDEDFQNPVDIMFDELENGVRVEETDENGEIIFEIETDDGGNIKYAMDKDGKPILDSDGNPVPKYKKDKYHNKIPVYKRDENGNYIYYEGQEPNPNHFAVSQYKKYKLAAGKTAKSILISCGARLAPFDIGALREIMSYDEMELDKLGCYDEITGEKTALFIIVSDTTDTYNFVVAMLYTQLFNQLCTVADDIYGGRLPVHVRCLLDEFANIGQIPNFDKLIATIRSREISASIILQSQSQLKAIYKDNADTIVGNCDTMLFLGGKEKSTLKELSEILGKQTIDLFNTSETRGQSPSNGLNYNKTGRELMSQDELAVMDGSKCILQIRGVRPFFSDKFDITKHTKYKLLSDYDEKNLFDVVKYMEEYRKKHNRLSGKQGRVSDETYIYEEKISEIEAENVKN